MFINLPTGQAKHLLAPASLVYDSKGCLTAHDVQTVSENVEYLPASHLTHVLFTMYFPPTQPVQSEEDELLIQLMWARSLSKASQGLHSLDFSSSAYFPAGQSVHTPSEVYFPTGHM